MNQLRRIMFLLAVVLPILLGGQGIARASHSLGTCDVTYSPSSGDIESLIEAQPDHRTVCMTGTFYASPSSNYDFDLAGQNDTIIRPAAGHRVVWNGALRVADSADRLHFYGFHLRAAPHDCDANPGDSSCSVLDSTTHLNGDELEFERMDVTNQGAETTCFHTGNQDDGGNITTDTEVSYSRIYDCGEDGEHDHGFYLGRGRGWSIHDNAIFANGSRGIATHNNGSGEITQNVIAGNCVGHRSVAGYRCSANLVFSSGVDNLDVHDNVVAYPSQVNGGSPYNASYYQVSDGANARFDDNCAWTYDSPGDDGGGIHPSLDGEIASVSGNTESDPDFSSDPWYGFESPIIIWRSYVVGAGPGTPDSACLDRDPDGPVGGF